MQQQCFDCRTWTDMAGKLESLGDMHAKSSRRLSVAKRSRTACRTDSTKPRGQLDIDVFEGGICADHEQSANTTEKARCSPPVGTATLKPNHDSLTHSLQDEASKDCSICIL